MSRHLKANASWHREGTRRPRSDASNCCSLGNIGCDGLALRLKTKPGSSHCQCWTPQGLPILSERQLLWHRGRRCSRSAGNPPIAGAPVQRLCKAALCRCELHQEPHALGQSLADRAGVGIGTVYRHFASRAVGLVTGANQGSGLQIVRDLVSYGFTVVVGSRDFARGQAAARGRWAGCPRDPA